MSNKNNRLAKSSQEKQPQRIALFSVSGNSRTMRRERIEAVAKIEPSLGFLAAIFDFEWMVRRALLALSDSPTPDIRASLEKEHGWKAYQDAWRRFVKRDKGPATLIDAIVTDPSQRRIISGAIADAFKARHPIVHGANGFIKDEIATFNKDLLLSASDELEKTIAKFGSKWNTAFMIIRRMRKSCADRDAHDQNRKMRKMKVAHEKRMEANAKKHLGIKGNEASTQV